MYKILLFTLCFFLVFSCSEKQNSVTKNQKQIIIYYNKIDKLNKINNDSLDYYSKKIVKISQNETNEFRAIARIAKSMVDNKLGLFDLALKNCKETVELLKTVNNDTIKAKNILVIGFSKFNKGELTQSLNHYFQALKLYEKCQHKLGMAIANNKIADIYFTKNDTKNSIKFLNKSLAILKAEPEHPVRISTFHTLANIYGMAGNFKEALKIDDSCIKIGNKLDSHKMIIPFLDNKANCYMYSNQLDSAQYYFDKCLVLDKLVGNPKQIADNYSNQAILYSMKNDFPKAEKFASESIFILKNINNKTNLLNSYQSLGDIYEKQGKLKEALSTRKDFFATYKSLIDEKKESATAEFQEIYESEKKEKQIIEQQTQAKQKNIWLFVISILTLLTGLIGFLIYKQQRQKNQQQDQENQLKLAIEKIENQNKLQEQRLSISRDLHDNIGSQLTFIISSVDNVKYGFDITNQKLDNKLTNISSFAKDTILELRDTIWAMNSNEISYEDLEIRITNFIEKAKISQENISFSFAIDPDLKNQKLSSVEGMNVYRTIQEAINNGLKYAKAEIVSVNIKKQNHQTKITISDNGVGFDIETIEKGNGLNNMKKRIEEIGGTFSLASGKEGTKIVVLI